MTTKRADKILAGDLRAGSRLMRELDDRKAGAIDELKAIYPHTGRGYVVGVTGNPGSGKSTVVDALIAHYRSEGYRVGVVAVDPTSPFTGGAILGDRIRMQAHALDDGVFIRSLATRGHLGGLSRSTFDVVAVLDALGFDRILVETVGVGQDEVDVMRAAHSSLVITVPGLGDDIQAIKAGILEIADVLCVNKADREGVDRTIRDLTHMLQLRGHDERAQVEIVRTIASLGARGDSGIGDLASAIDRHRERTSEGEEGARRDRSRAAAYVSDLVRDRLAERAAAAVRARGGLDALAEEVAARRKDPYTAAEEVLGAL